ncbi:MAG TPA: hypothetical protein GX000_01170 [Actinomyces sp.]|nr:DUF6318 family protein [Acidobacteriota bacterium]HHT40249.1 hypothetical protein [Actinomyces sp.]
MSRGLKLAASIAIPVLALSGCSQAEAEAEPVITYPSETVQETTEPTTEPWVVPSKEELYPYPKPELPVLAKEHSQNGAEAFAEYFLEAYAYAMATRDADALMSLCTERSEYCAYHAYIIDSALATDTYFSDYLIYDLDVPGSLEGGSNEYVEWGAQVVGYVSPHVIHIEKESDRKDIEEFHFVAAVEVSWDDGWKVEEAEVIPYEDLYDE